MVQLLLTAAPGTAASLSAANSTPLHFAARSGHAAVTQLLLAAAPETAAAVDTSGCTPLHHAAESAPSAAASQLLLAAAPETAEARNLHGQRPLDLAIYDRRLDTIRCLLAAAPTLTALQELSQGGEAMQPVFVNFIPARLPLSDAEWALVPSPCSGLGRALPAALAQSSTQASRLVQHLPPAYAERLRTAARCLARAQRHSQVQLPTPIVWWLLSHFDAPFPS